MLTVFKYKISGTTGNRETMIKMPENSRLLRVGVDPLATHKSLDYLRLWALVNPDLPTVLRHFRIFGTGHRIPDDAIYVDSSICPPFVWHLFEIFPGRDE